MFNIRVLNQELRLKILKKSKKQGINLAVKRDKPQAVTYHPLIYMLRISNTYGTSKTQKFLHFDVVNDKINDCLEFSNYCSRVTG